MFTTRVKCEVSSNGEHKHVCYDYKTCMKQMHCYSKNYICSATYNKYGYCFECNNIKLIQEDKVDDKNVNMSYHVKDGTYIDFLHDKPYPGTNCVSKFNRLEYYIFRNELDYFIDKRNIIHSLALAHSELLDTHIHRLNYITRNKSLLELMNHIY